MSFELLKRLAEAHGVSGREDDVREVIRAELADLGLSAEEDAIGNLFVEAFGPTDAPEVLLDAHMDEIGLMVSYLHAQGQLAFATLGGWDARNLPAQEVTIKTRTGKVAGVIGSKPPHILKGDEATKPWAVEALWIDVGTTSADETRALGVGIGDPVVLDGACVELCNGVLRGKAFDDRFGCYVVLQTLRAIREKKLDVRVCASFTTSEEVGLRGIEAIGNRREWAAALHFEATVAADMPGVAASQSPTVFGKGPAITIADRSTIVPERIVRYLEKTARDAGIPYQFKLPIYGGTNAGGMHKSGRGVLCGIIAAPCRYIHSPVTLIKASDMEATLKLAEAAVLGIGELVK